MQVLIIKFFNSSLCLFKIYLKKKKILTAGTYIFATCNSARLTTVDLFKCNISILSPNTYEQLLLNYQDRQQVIIIKGDLRSKRIFEIIKKMKI